MTNDTLGHSTAILTYIILVPSFVLITLGVGNFLLASRKVGMWLLAAAVLVLAIGVPYNEHAQGEARAARAQVLIAWADDQGVTLSQKDAEKVVGESANQDRTDDQYATAKRHGEPVLVSWTGGRVVITQKIAD